MNKAKINFWLDVALLCVLITTIATGYALEHNPARVRSREGFMVRYSPTLDQSASPPSLTAIHVVSALALFSGMSIHLGLHGSWLRASLRRRTSGASAQSANNVMPVSLLIVACASTAVSGLLRTRGWHEVSGVMLIIFVSAHLLAHRKWITACVRRHALGQR